MDNDITLAKKFSFFQDKTKNKAPQSKTTKRIIKNFFMEYVVKDKTMWTLPFSLPFSKEDFSGVIAK